MAFNVAEPQSEDLSQHRGDIHHLDFADRISGEDGRYPCIPPGLAFFVTSGPVIWPPN